MIEWQEVDKDNPPVEDVSYLFYFEGRVFYGWILDDTDIDGFPAWEANEGRPSCYGVKWYARINYPVEPKRR